VELRFPTDRIVGVLDWSDAWHPERGPVLATGSVTVPDDQDIALDVSAVTGSHPSGGGSWIVTPDNVTRSVDLSFLELLPPDVIDRLTLHDVDTASFRAVRHLQLGLTHLYLAFSRLGDTVLSHVAALTKLTYLQTFGNHFTDDGVQQLAALKSLQHLYLEEETLTAAAFAFTSELPHLERLGLQDVPITAAELAAARSRLPGVGVG
jgi:hypothetical protein